MLLYQPGRHQMHRQMPHPVTKAVGVVAVGIWLSRHAYWSDNLYSSWILPPDLIVDGTCGAWNSDFQSVYTLI